MNGEMANASHCTDVAFISPVLLRGCNDGHQEGNVTKHNTWVDARKTFYRRIFTENAPFLPCGGSNGKYLRGAQLAAQGKLYLSGAATLYHANDGFNAGIRKQTGRIL
ncbi:hypothetical protein [Klebsiella aerogenes]|uniref:hypothetical protein n=1 Tax=Klebsiella aerogenes TaxID=548 RepID=UPI001F2B8363|nr:hypothetical protein [Klebsiella aerogenes]